VTIDQTAWATGEKLIFSVYCSEVFEIKIRSTSGGIYGFAPEFKGKNTVAPSSVADPDPGSGALLTPGSGIRNRFFPDPGSKIHIFESLVTIFWVKSSMIL
jgi:hypothetical protein